MHDIRAIRENPDAYAAALSRRPSVDGKAEVKKILELDAEVRKATHARETAEASRNSLSKQIGQAKAKGDTSLFEELKVAVDVAKATIEVMSKTVETKIVERDDLLARLPNVPDASVPVGADEHGNKEVRRKGVPRQFSFTPKDHADIGEGLKMMDFEAAARMSGARFVVLKGQLARLERALTQFMLDVQTGEHGYVEHATPLMVKPEAMRGTGQLPKFADDLFAIKYRTTQEDLDKIALLLRQKFHQLTDAEAAMLVHGAAMKLDMLKQEESAWKDMIDNLGPQEFYAFKMVLREVTESKTGVGFYLIPTAEVSLTNIYREQIVDADTLPVRMTAATPCFRSEAGSAGRDTKGMIRQHQFIKVELVSITKPEDSEAEHERMTQCAETILQRLGLPYRTMLLCTGDMGFGAVKTYDLEVWLPSQNTYREISSCSNCGDFQARRMDGRYRAAPTGDNPKPKPEYFHTLNGSGLAVGRTLVAVLENYQREDGKVDVPEVLQPYMGGLKVIG